MNASSNTYTKHFDPSIQVINKAMSKLEYQQPVHMYNVIGRDVLQDQRNASIDASTWFRDAMRQEKCTNIYEAQLPLPTTPRVYQSYGPLPIRSDSISRVHMLEQRDRRFAENAHLTPINKVFTDMKFDISKDPRYNMIQDDLASKTTVCTGGAALP